MAGKQVRSNMCAVILRYINTTETKLFWKYNFLRDSQPFHNASDSTRPTSPEWIFQSLRRYPAQKATQQISWLPNWRLFVSSLSSLFFIRLQIVMANFSGVNFTNATKMASPEGHTANVSLEVSDIITIIVNSITCPFTVLLNVLVIMAVKRRPRLQTNSNILLACLAATDALTGLIVQPSFILWKISQLLGAATSKGILSFHDAVLNAAILSSSLHLMLVTFERLLAIKFTMRYLNIITEKNIKIAVTVFWIIAFTSGTFRLLKMQLTFLLVEFTLVLGSCIVFIPLAYMILYRETRLHQKMIKTQQLPQEEVERFTKENKALKTTVYVVGAVIFCFLPAGVHILIYIVGFIQGLLVIWESWIRTFIMLNSLFNLLIYCSRQKEMRKFVFRRSQIAHTVNKCKRESKKRE